MITVLTNIANYENNILQNKSINIQDINIANQLVLQEKLKIEPLKLTIEQGIYDLRVFMNRSFVVNGKMLNPFDSELTINACIEFAFRTYSIQCEELLRVIFILEQNITIKNDNLQNTLQYNSWFGIRGNNIQNGGGKTDLIVPNNQITIFESIPMFGMKYELATMSIQSILSKYNISNIEGSNLDLTVLTKYINQELKGGKKRKTVKKRKPVKKRKNINTNKNRQYYHHQSHN